MPDTPRKPEVPWADLIDDAPIIRFGDKDVSLAEARWRFLGKPKRKPAPLDPENPTHRFPCELSAAAGAGHCYRQAHERVEGYALCPQHAEDMRAAIATIEEPGAAVPVPVQDAPSAPKMTEAAFRASKGITTPKAQAPSRRDRSKEYAGRNRRRRRAALSQPS